MSKLLLKTLGIGEDGRPRPDESLETRINIAASIFLLDACYNIPQCDDQRRGHIVGIILSTFTLPQALIEELINISNAGQAREFDLFQFRNQINQLFSKEDLIAIIEMCWRIIYSEASLTLHEEQFAELMKGFFLISDIDFSKARKKVKEGK